MKGQLIGHGYVWAALAGWSLALGAFPALAIQEDIPDEGEGVNVLATGPIHEAFAETVADRTSS